MSPRQYVGVAVRLFSIWLALSSARAAFTGFAATSSGAAAATLPFFFAVMFLALAALLWFFPLFVAGALVQESKREDKVEIASSEGLQAACVVLGLYVLVVNALPSITNWLIYAAVYIANGMPAANMGEERNVDGMIGLVQLIAGFILVRKAQRLSLALLK